MKRTDPPPWRRLIPKSKIEIKDYFKPLGCYSLKSVPQNADCPQQWWTCQLLCRSDPLPYLSPLNLASLLLALGASLQLAFYAPPLLPQHNSYYMRKQSERWQQMNDRSNCLGDMDQLVISMQTISIHVCFRVWLLDININEGRHKADTTSLCRGINWSAYSLEFMITERHVWLCCHWNSLLWDAKPCTIAKLV